MQTVQIDGATAAVKVGGLGGQAQKHGVGDKRVVVTGLGVCSAAGCELDEFFANLCAGATLVRPVEHFRREGLTRCEAICQDAAEVRARLLPHEADLSEAAGMGVVAARGALQHAGLGAFLGDSVSAGRHSGAALALFAGCALGAGRQLDPGPGESWATMTARPQALLWNYPPAAVVARVAQALGLEDEVSCSAASCAAGAYAIGAAFDYLRQGRGRIALAGGLEEIGSGSFIGFHQLRALTDNCRPFDSSRNGLVFGQAAAFLVLETLASAEARGAIVYAEVLGIGFSNDAYHLVAPEPQGEFAAVAIQRALAEAGIRDLQQVGYMNAHGTGTPTNDLAESRAIAAVFGDYASGLPTSSIKAITGHTMGAAGAVEALATVLAIHRGRLPPTAGLRHPDPQLADINLIMGAPLERDVAVAVSNSFGFGGNNAAVVLGRRNYGDERRAAAAQKELRPVYIKAGAALAASEMGTQAFLRRLTQGGPFSREAAQADVDVTVFLGSKGLRHVTRPTLLLAAALEEGLGAEWPQRDSQRAGAAFGALIPGVAGLFAMYEEFKAYGPSKVNPMRVALAAANVDASWWLMRRGIHGLNATVTSGLCSGLDAIRSAAIHIELGRFDEVVAGGVESCVAPVWNSILQIGYCSGPLAEAVGAVALTADPADAWARLEASAAAFAAQTPLRAVMRVRQALLAGLAQHSFEAEPCVDLVVTALPWSTLGETDVLLFGEPAPAHLDLSHLVGNTLGASGGLSVLAAALLLRRGPHRGGNLEAPQPRRAMVLGWSPEGYASGVILAAV